MTTSSITTKLHDIENPGINSSTEQSTAETPVSLQGRVFQVLNGVVGALLFVPGIGSGAYAIYEYIVKDNLTGGLATGGAVVYCLAGIYVWIVISPLKSLDGKVKDLTNQNNILNKINSNLEKNIGDLKKIESAWKIDIENAKHQTETLNKTLLDRTAEIKSGKEDLEKTVIKLEALSKLYQQFKESVISASNEIGQFQTVNQIFKTNVSEITGDVKKLGETGSLFIDQITQAENTNQFIDNQNKVLEKILENLKGQTNDVIDCYMKIKNDCELLKSQLVKIDESDDKFLNGTKENTKIVSENHSTIEDIQKVLKEIEEINKHQ